MPVLRVKNQDDTWSEIPAIVGPQGPQGEKGEKGDPGTPAYTYGTEDLTAGVSPLETGKLHFVYE